jgi:hypothetical protein
MWNNGRKNKYTTRKTEQGHTHEVLEYPPLTWVPSISTAVVMGTCGMKEVTQ